MAESLRGVVALIDNPEFASLRRAAEASSLSRERFRAMTMPAGCDPDEAWQLLQVLRRQTGVVSPVPAMLGDPFDFVWYTIPRDVQEMAESIIERCCAHSRLSSRLARLGVTRGCLQPILEELLATIRWDGGSASYEGLRSVVVGERLPSGDEERIVANYMRMYVEVLGGAYDDLRCERVCAGLFDGVTDVVERNAKAAEVMNRFIDETLRGHDVPKVFYSAHFSEFSMRYRLFSTWNAVFGSLLRRLFFVRVGYPGASVLSPFARADRRCLPSGGADGIASRGGDDGGSPSAWGTFEGVLHRDSTGTSIDATAYYAMYIEALHGELAELEAEIDRLTADDVRLAEAVRASELINYRQKDVLLAILEDDDMEVSTYEYRDSYRIAYSTARSDLGGLQRMGLLVSRLVGEGKSLVYHACPRVRAVAGGIFLAR